MTWRWEKPLADDHAILLFRHGKVTARIRSSEHARSASVRLRAEVWVNWRGVLGVPRCWVCRGWWAEVGAEVHGRTARLGPFHLLCTCGGLSKRAASTHLPLSAVKYEQGCGPAPHCRWDARDAAAARRTRQHGGAPGLGHQRILGGRAD